MRKKLEKKTILIAEDEDSNYLLLERLLFQEGHTVLRAYNGLEAVETFHKHPETDLVLMDIKMPKLNGFDATQRIKQTDKNIPVIAVTAYALTGDKQKALDAGCDDYISKPIIKKDFIALINKYLLVS